MLRALDVYTVDGEREVSQWITYLAAHVTGGRKVSSVL